MKKLLSVFAVALLIAAIGVVSAPGNDAQAAEQPGIRPLAQGPSEYPGADNITVYLECQFDGRVRLKLSWTGYNFGSQWVDLSLANNGWQFGSFIGIGPFASGQNSAVWDGLLPNAWHYTRVNTLTAYGWQASATIAFFTRNDCYQYPPQPVPIPPYPQPIPPYPQPIPPYPQPVPPGPIGCNGQSTPSTYQAGNCPPAGICPNFATILIYPAPPQGPQGCVWTTKGEPAAFALGEAVQYCYWVNMPMYVRILAYRPDGSQYSVVDGYDDGRGGCLAPVATGLPQGQRTVYMYGGPNGASQQLDQTSFFVQ